MEIAFLKNEKHAPDNWLSNNSFLNLVSLGNQILHCLKKFTFFFEYHNEPIYFSAVKEFSSSSYTSEDWTLEQHSLRVLHLFFRQHRHFHFDQLHCRTVPFCVALLLHDIGKRMAHVRSGSKRFQHNYTVAIMKKYWQKLGWHDTQDLYIDIIGMDPIGGFLRGFIDFPTLINKIQSITRHHNWSLTDAWKIVMLYFSCDAGAYQILIARCFTYNHNNMLLLQPQLERLQDLLSIPELQWYAKQYLRD